MTLWIWLGGGLMAIGTIVALAPRVRRRVLRSGVRFRNDGPSDDGPGNPEPDEGEPAPTTAPVSV